MPNDTTKTNLKRHRHDQINLSERQQGHDAVFRRFKAANGRVILSLDWRKAGTRIDSSSFNIHGRVLTVFGDLYDGVYVWNDAISWPWLANLDLSYFAEKCVAGPYGRGARTWNKEKAFTRTWELLSERANEESDGYEPLSEEKVANWIGPRINLGLSANGLSPKAVRMYLGDACESQLSFYELLRHEGLFGSDAWELGELGMDVCIETRIHLLSLNYAMQRVSPEVWFPVVPEVGVDYNTFCATHDGESPTFLLAAIDGWTRRPLPDWFPAPETCHEKADGAATRARRNGA